MPVTNIGFGGTTAGSYESISGRIAEYVPHKFALLFNTASKVVASGALKKIKADGKEITVTVVPPCGEDVSWGKDFDRWPVGSSQSPQKMRIPPTQILAKVSMGQMASTTKLAEPGEASYIGAQLDARIKQMSLQLARGIFGGAVSPVTANLGTWSGTAAGSTVTMDFMDVSLFKEGAGVDYLPNVGLSYVVKVLTVVRQAVTSGTTNSRNVAGRVTFENSVPNTGINTGTAVGLAVPLGATTTNILDVFRPRGSTLGFGQAATLTGAALTSFTDIATAATLQGFTASNLAGWQGNSQVGAGVYNQEVMAAFAGGIEAASGEAPSHYFGSPQLLRAHGASFQVIGSSFGNTAGANNGSTPRNVGADASKYDRSPSYMLNGVPFVADISCPADTIVAHNDDHVFLGEYSEVAPRTQSGEPMQLDQTFVANNYFLSGGYQLYTNMRCASGVISGFTGL